MSLSPRLKAIVNLLNLSAKVADIGTDHAYLPIYLAKETNSSILIASDINVEPYKAAVEHVRRANLADKIEVRLGPGLSTLESGEVDTVVIAGMGSRNIREILKNNYILAQELDSLVLQPMAGAASLRRWLVNNNFKITDETLVQEGDKLYQIMAIKPGKMKIDDLFLLELGPILIEKRDRLLFTYFEELKAKWTDIIASISTGNAKHHKINELEEKIDRLLEVKNELLND